MLESGATPKARSLKEPTRNFFDMIVGIMGMRSSRI